MEGLIISGISLGGTVTFIPASYFADYFGRKMSVGLGSAIMVIASVVQAATTGRWAFFGTRIAMGIGLGFSQTAAPPLTTEIAHPRHRGVVTAIFQATWYWGAILAAAVCLGTLYIEGNAWSWRIPCLVQCLFPAIQLLGLFIVPESPRWLVSKDRRDEALQILARYHGNGDTSDPLVQFEFSEICGAIDLENSASQRHQSGWSAFLATKGTRHRLAICILVGFMIQWAGNGVISYYLAPILRSVGITNPSQQSAINLGLQAWNAVCAAGGAVAAERYGRRPLWMLSTTLMLLFFALVTALSAVFAESAIQAAGSAVVAFLYLFYGAYDIAYTPLSIAYPVEIMPFYLRTKGLSLSLTAQFGAGFFNQFVNPIALGAIAWKFYFVYLGLLVSFVAVVYFVFPETKGHTLEEIAVIFDGPGTETEMQRDLAAIIAGDREVKAPMREELEHV